MVHDVLPVVNQAGATAAATNPLLGTFKGLCLDLQSDKLYDLDSVIPDVLGLGPYSLGRLLLR